MKVSKGRSIPAINRCRRLLSSLLGAPSNALFYPFLGEGSLAKNRLQKRIGYPHSNLSNLEDLVYMVLGRPYRVLLVTCPAFARAASPGEGRALSAAGVAAGVQPGA